MKSKPARINASSTVKHGDFKGLKYLGDLLGRRFLRGIVLYTGDKSVPFGSNMYVLPVSTLWRTGEMHHENLTFAITWRHVTVIPYR